jgi:hypothetical protein
MGNQLAAGLGTRDHPRNRLNRPTAPLSPNLERQDQPADTDRQMTPAHHKKSPEPCTDKINSHQGRWIEVKSDSTR